MPQYIPKGPRPCAICLREDRAAIDAAMQRHEPVGPLAKRLHVSTSTLVAHVPHLQAPAPVPRNAMTPADTPHTTPAPVPQKPPETTPSAPGACEKTPYVPRHYLKVRARAQAHPHRQHS